MNISQKPEFVKALAKLMGAYGKPLPEKALLSAWWDVLEPFPLAVVAASFTAYCDENGEFAPVPAGIAKRCKVMDGRPGTEEAWATALPARDEQETVIWTTETAQAFWICRPILQSGDEVGARMAFKEAYVRLVDVARRCSMPTKWEVCQGQDKQRRELVLKRAAELGRLPAPVAAVLLPAPVRPEQVDRTGLERVKAALKSLVPGSEKARLRREKELAEVQERKAEINQQVAQYQGQGEKA